MTIYHDSRNPLYRQPQGAVTCGAMMKLCLHAQGVRKAWLRLWWNNTESRVQMRHKEGDLYECHLSAPCSPGLLWYFFIAEDDNGGTLYFGNAEDGLGGVGQVSGHEPSGYQVTVYDPAYETPEWLRDGIMLQIMVDRYFHWGPWDVTKLPPASYYHIRWDDTPALCINDDKYGDNVNNDYFGGNLRGVTEKLDYIQSLGVTVIYFNPIFKARSNHKYNTGDYRTIDPAFGTEADFKALCKAAKKRGIRVILDGVFSHTGSDSLYFNRDGSYGTGGAYNDPRSPYAGWYRFRRWPEDYECWWGFKTLPNVDEENPSYQDFIIDGEDSVTAHWLRAGASGWRLDVADELPMAFIRKIRQRIRREKPDAALIGEVWEDPTKKVAYDELRSYCLGDTLDCTMNYPLRALIFDFLRCRMGAVEFARQLESQQENMPLPFFYSQMNLLGSHDTPRAINMLADIGDMSPDRHYRRPLHLSKEDYERGRRRLLAAWALVNMLPGIPCLYYGDEAGMTGMADPYCRGTYPWGQEDVPLREAFREIMTRRRASVAMRTGTLRLHAVGADVVMVERRVDNGRDAFGKAAKDELRVLAVNRSCEHRWVEFQGRGYEIPGESAVLLDIPEAKPAKPAPAGKRARSATKAGSGKPLAADSEKNEQ